MMLRWKIAYELLLVLTSLFFSAAADRRIKGAKELSSERRYAVYMVKAPISPQRYDEWLCGGAIVTTQYIVTSAACVEDVKHLYVIAGYAKYVSTENLEHDECTRRYKKKVVYTCLPKAYEFDYHKIEKWSYIDIAVVKVESPYDFHDQEIRTYCSYEPRAIEINYDMKYQEPGIDAIVMGWGHQEIWRKPEDTKDYNSEKIHYAPTLLHDKKDCKKYFSDVPELVTVIDKYMICTLEAGNLDDQGNQIEKIRPLADGCTPVLEKMLAGTLECEEDDEKFMDDTLIDDTIVDSTRKMFSKVIRRQQTRKNGFCQNDHGGPLVTWMGGREILIGVASVFRVTNNSECAGPYLYTSTYCNGIFLDCVTDQSNETKRRSLCDRPPSERGFDMIERRISWANHPHGPADNERHLMMRPQIPLSMFGG